ncbi:MAG: hypothetical protein Q8M24_26515 [Pseudolabrys sp.]|nr:hypothetical protein [Pseudolabrys sp.]MDP2299008.1 hypothetical protein [Pseudolabrys sp.]
MAQIATVIAALSPIRHPESLTHNAANEIGAFAKPVMPGLVPGIHVLASEGNKDVDGRDKPGHDEK